MDGTTPLLARLGGMLIYVAAGWSLFLVLFNRALLLIRDGRHKSLLVWGSLVVITAASLAAGYLAALSLWVVLPAILLCALAVGELHRWLTRLRTRAAGPVEVRKGPASPGRPLTTCHLVFRRYEEACLPRGYRKTRIAHISDLHVNDRLPFDYYRSAVRMVTESEPDLVFVTGDFVTDKRFASLLPDLLTGLHGRHGVFAVLGNHDYWSDVGSIEQVLSGCGITHLGNRSVMVGNGDGSRFMLNGCEDPWGAERWHSPAPREPVPLLALTHTADNIYALAQCGATAVFAGHYHGGQINLPLAGTLAIPSKYGRRFDHGHFKVGNTHLFVTSGIGAHAPALRIYCNPEVLVADLLPVAG